MELYGKKHMLKDLSSEIDNLALNSNSSSKEVLDGLKNVTKTVYDHLYRDNSLTELKTKSYRRLLIDGFDAEQIFQQIELQNKSALEHINQSVLSIDDSKYLISESNQHTSGDKEISLEKSYIDSDENKEYVFDDDSDSSLEKLKFKKSKLSAHKVKLMSNGDNADFQSNNEFDSEENSGSDFSDEDELDSGKHSNSSNALKNKKDKSKAQKPKFKSVVDDQFFKLSNLNEFLRIEDMKAENKLEENDGSEEDIDYYQDIPSDDFDDEDEFEIETGNKMSSKDIMYDDFFDAPDSDDEDNNDATEMLENESNYKDDLEENLDDENASDQEDDDEYENQVANHQNSKNEDGQISKTPFEIEQEQIKKTIENYEDLLVQPSEWHLTGEVAASSRPKDSLLHQDTDFDVNAKPVLIEDATLCEKTEKAIKSIIKNKAYSDGQRKFKPNEDIIAMKKDVILDQTKSKKSLAAVYEDEFLKKKYGEQEQENPKHVEIKKMMDTLLPELQALFSHIPKPAIPDIKIVSNLPAITVEDVAPTSVSDVTLLAPEEVKKKTGVIKGVTERTDTDRKRERRKKKMMQKMKFKKAQSESAENPLSVKDRKQEKINTLKKLKQNRITKIAEVSGEKIKSSKDFFSRLQETVASKAQPTQSKKRKRK